MKQIKLTRTQYFLRFIKKHNIYHTYFSQVHDRGKYEYWFEGFKESETDPCGHIKGMNINEIFWMQMMDWSENLQYNIDGFDYHFWEGIDNAWTAIWGKHSGEIQEFIKLNKKDINELM